MKFLIVLSSVFALCAGSSLEILSSPSNIKFPDESSTLRTSQLSSLNQYILGLSANEVKGFDVETDIFSRPRALAVITVEGVDKLNLGKSYSVNVDGVNNAGIEQELALLFGQDRQTVQLNAGGITGSKLALSAQEKTVDTTNIKTKIPQLRKELESIYKLASALKSAGLNTDNSADIFRVTISGLAGASDAEELESAMDDIKNAVNALNEAINTAYGNQAVVELLIVSSPIQASDSVAFEQHRISKREATDDYATLVQRFTQVREQFMVTQPVSSDYSAMFTIFLGLVVILTVGLIYIVVGMVSINPEKDSIIYRMTTTRMKKD